MLPCATSIDAGIAHTIWYLAMVESVVSCRAKSLQLAHFSPPLLDQLHATKPHAPADFFMSPFLSNG